MELLSALFLVILTFLVVTAFYHKHLMAEIPPGFIQRKKLCFYHYLLNFGFVLAKTSEKLGLASEIHVIRTIMNTVPPLKDKHLFIKDVRFEKIKVRIYQPKIPTTGQRRGVLYFHGGVGQFGSIRAYERTCCYYARKSDSVIVSVGYRLAPEYPYPTQFEDCLAATIHFMRTAEDYGVDPTRVITCGDSSGGTLAAAVAQAMVNRKDLPKLRAQILIYPFLQAVDFNLPSYQQNKTFPILTREQILLLGLKYLNKDVTLLNVLFEGAHIPEDFQLKYQKWLSPDNIPEEFKPRGYKPGKIIHPLSDELHALTMPTFDPVFSPLIAEDTVIAQLPEAFILTCEFDVLRDDGLLYKKRLEDHGIRVTWCHLEQGFHGIVFLAPLGRIVSFQSGNKGIKQIIDFLKSI
ncbi:arylacetamide deacetylase-like 4 [Rhea pennata]|uniref:arylacetamide deacetylase-like 4 n=1 Tax=Rhea pennata TaxID=8795 RepID=UPI002E267B6A